MSTLCFIDLDGVLVDFVDGAFRLHNINIPWPDIRWNFVEQAGMDPDVFWSALDSGFWSRLLPHKEMPYILGAAEKRFGLKNVFLCSSPCETLGCITGKALWVEKHLPQYSRRLILTNRKEVFSGPGRVLIDDRDENVRDWVATAGIGILVPRPWNATRNTSRDVSSIVVDAIEKI